MREEVNCPKNREKKKGMVAFDLDHTLLDHKKGAITPSSLEAIERLTSNEGILNYGFALGTAIVGLIANSISASVLHGHHGTTDYNSHAAYLHVLSDALTEIGAIIGLLCAMFWNITWIDSLVAVVSTIVVLRWAKRLLWDTGRALTKR